MMSSSSQSDIFKPNFFFWKIFGIWHGSKPSKYYKYYSFFYLFITLFVYNILLTLNLVYTPLKIETLIREVIFYFTEITVTAKVLMILIMRDNIIDAFRLLDCKELEGDDERSKAFIEKLNSIYKKFWKMYAIMSNFVYSSQVFLPVLVHLIFKTKVELPICKYFFLSEEVRQDYFIYWFSYQSFGMYGHMMYNVNIDTFIIGLLLMIITQLKVLNFKLNNLKLAPKERKYKIEVQEHIQTYRLNKCLRRYDIILKYCSSVQKVISVTMFVQFGMSTIIICVVMCGLLLPSTTETYVFMVTYFFAMTLQIFLPGFLGTQISYESQEIMFAAYNTKWVPRSESFKKSIKILVQRSSVPIRLTGSKIFQLSLGTFTSIMKTAYSFFTLLRNVQEGQESRY